MGDTILSGPYRGLKKNESAIEVATAIQEQFNGFEKLQSGGDFRRLAEGELKRRGFETAGVKQAVAEGWKNFKVSEKQYTEIVEGTIDNCTRSDLTTADSLKLYTSVFDESTPLTTADRIFLTDRKPDHVPTKIPDSVDSAAPRTDSFVKKAQRLGIPVLHSEISKARYSPLFKFERRRRVPEGFEQINEDMFARKDNKFMVFNGAGVDSWHGTQPLTKTSHVDNILKTLHNN